MNGKIVAGKYRLNAPLGRGGMAEVWSATNTFTERKVAIKFMSPQVAKTPEAATRFLKEAKVSARISQREGAPSGHPNIIDVLDVGQTEEGQLFLVMELLTGSSLELALRHQTPPMTLHELSLVMTDVAEALAAAHRAGIVHRDLKPTNIFLHTASVSGSRPIPKVLDFGVSKFLEEDSNQALTMAGTVLGSPLYMSPEQARGESNIDGRTDVFAFGAILFEAICGYRAYEAKNFNALIVKIATTEPKDIDACAPHVPDSLRRVVRACLETDLERRARTFEDVIRMMRQATPELETAPARLPAPVLEAALRATDVLRVGATDAHPAERRAALHDTTPGASMYPSLPASVAPGVLSAAVTWPTPAPSAPSWTPNTSYTSVTISPQRQRHHSWLVTAAAALLVGGVGIGAVVATRPRSIPARAATPAPGDGSLDRPGAASVLTTTPAARPATTPGAASVLTMTPAARPATTPGASSEPPTVNVDALPGTTDPVRTVTKGSGRLSLAASPESCSIAIDGTDRGPTPLTAIDLTAGSHKVSCTTSSGRQRSASIMVEDGVTSKYSFSLDH